MRDAFRCTWKAPGRMSEGWRLGCAGMSLIELLIALTISSVSISAAMHMFSGYGPRFTTQHTTMVSNQESRIAFDVLASEVRLAGAGLLAGESPLLTAGREEIEFFANLSGSSTMLTQAVGIGQQELLVETGTGWPKGKQILLCTAVHCMWNRLASDGRKQQLALAMPTGEQWPMRSAVFLLNRVRYYLKQQEGGKLRLMRDVDGGVNTLLADVERFQVEYFNREGRITSDMREVVRIRVTLDMGAKNLNLVRDIAIRM
jgi:prepilin-type N-terminal cleavage/methylation domain-containing protein